MNELPALNNRPFMPLSLVLLLAWVCLSVPVAATEKVPDSKTELESVRSQIEEVKSGLDAAHSESELLQDELRKIEIESGKQFLKLKELEELILAKQSKITELNKLIADRELALGNERRYLARQIRAAYMTGRNDYLKLLLNQEDPSRIGRMLAYHEYYNRSHTATIRAITGQVDLIRKLRESIQSETALLEQLMTRQSEKNRELASYRKSRHDILQRLRNDITAKNQQLKTLVDHEQKITALLNQLDRQKDSASYFEDIPPFSTLQGKLEWPAKGRLLHRFGSNRRGASLKWDGVMIASPAGNEVHAIHSGKVIFADWFRNLGLLIILDHGEDYMSLYGYNQSLLKKSGDWVLAGEPIAYAGDSGGQEAPGVYFEIRHQGKPLDPSFWCKR